MAVELKQPGLRYGVRSAQLGTSGSVRVPHQFAGPEELRGLAGIRSTPSFDSSPVVTISVQRQGDAEAGQFTRQYSREMSVFVDLITTEQRRVSKSIRYFRRDERGIAVVLLSPLFVGRHHSKSAHRIPISCVLSTREGRVPPSTSSGAHGFI